MTANYPKQGGGGVGDLPPHRRSKRVAVVEAFADLQIMEIDLPPAPRDGAIVAIEFGGVCGSDVHVWHGARADAGPVVLGHEGVGRLAELGPGATSDYVGEPVAVGDRVYIAPQRPCHRCYACTVEHEFAACEHRDTYFWTPPDQPSPATYNDHVWLPAGAPFFKVPDHVPSLGVIALGCALPTMIQANERAGRIRLGDEVLVQGAGPVGLAATVLARASGAQKIVVVGAPAERLAHAHRLGADVTVDIETHSSADERQELLQTLLPRGADVIVEAAGVQAAFSEGVELLARGGRYLVVGLHYGSGTEPFDPRLANNRNAQIIGSALEQPSHQYGALRFVERHNDQFDIAAVVTHRFAIEEAQAALELMAAGGTIKAVIEPGRQPRAMQPETSAGGRADL